MSAHALLNLLNELGKGDKILGMFSKFNDTRAQMFCHLISNVKMDVIT